jgi:SAM-dependent methyltransferase
MSQSIEKQNQGVDYNLLAEEYALHRQVQPEVFTMLMTKGEIAGDSRVLEVGCGTGIYISAIQKAAGCSCWGIDPSVQMLNKARDNSRQVAFQIGRGEQIEFPEGYFDFLFSVDVIHHIKDHQKFFREAFRVLKPGGRLATVTESPQMIRTRKPFAVYFPETISVDLQRYPTPSSLIGMMEYARFTDISYETATFSFQRSNIQDFRDKAYSCLHLISETGFQQGIQRMEADLKSAPIQWDSRYLLVWGRKLRFTPSVSAHRQATRSSGQKKPPTPGRGSCAPRRYRSIPLPIRQNLTG